MPPTGGAPAVKAATIGVLEQLFPAPTLTTFGDPGDDMPDEIIGVLDVVITNERPTAGTARSYEETLVVTVIFSVFAPGNTPDAQQIATSRVWEMYRQFRDHFRIKPNETIGDVCREAYVANGELAERIAVQYADDGVTEIPSGRTSELTCELTAKTRIS